MSYLEYHAKYVPTGFRKLMYLHWPVILLLTAVASAGFIMLYSVSGGVPERWMEPQVQRFGMGMVLMICVAMVPIWFWRNMAVVAYLASLGLLLAVEFVGVERNGSQRWIDLGPMDLQPSELAKITLVMLLAAYYDWIPQTRKSHPLFVLPPLLFILLPTFLVLSQPDLGTSLLFLDPSNDPLGAGYHITQATIALGSGGWTGRGFMQGTQSRLNFLPEKHTDFIFTTLAEEFGFIGGIFLLVLYMLIIIAFHRC